MDKRLWKLRGNKPGIIRNSPLIVLVRILSGLTGTCFLGLGIIFVVQDAMDQDIIDMILPGTPEPGEQVKMDRERLTRFLAFTSFSFCLLLFFISTLSSMILRRNTYIMDVDDWINEEGTFGNGG